MKKRIDTNAAQQQLTAPAPAFSGLPQLPEPPAGIPADSAATPSAQDSPARIWKMGRVILRRESAHRGGKTVIVIHDFATHLPESVIGQIAKKVRTACGCGGTVKGRTVEIQGDQPARIRAVLESEGFEVAGVK